MTTVSVGCSGWFYDHWVGHFYPRGLDKAYWLQYYASHFSMVEINTTFYHWPLPETVDRWRENTESDFHFIVKGSRLFSHERPLSTDFDSLSAFFNLISRLDEKLKLVLWQYPKTYTMTRQSLEGLKRFCEQLRSLHLSCVFEFRHPSWFCDKTTRVLESNNYGFVDADVPEFLLSTDIPRISPYYYVRRHGRNGNWSYTRAQMARDGEAVTKAVKTGKFRTVYVAYNNDPYCNAVEDAKTMTGIVNTHASGQLVTPPSVTTMFTPIQMGLWQA